MDLEGFEGLEGFDGVCEGVWEGDGVDIGVELDELDDMIVFECVELVWRENENGSESTGRDPLVRIKSCVSRVTGLRPYRLGCVLIGLLELEKELMRLFIDNSALVLLVWGGEGENF